MAAYAATVTLDQPRRVPLGHGIGMVSGQCDVTNYNQTLAELTDITKHFRTIREVVVSGPSDNGHILRWNRTSKAFTAYKPTAASAPTLTGTDQPPPYVVEEVVTVASDAGTLAHLPAYIVAVDVTAGSTTGPFNLVPTGKTPATTQVAVTFTTGGLVFAAADAVTSVKVTYIPQQASGPFAASNMVVDESAVASASKVNLANRAFAVQYIYNSTNSALCTLEPPGEAPSATGAAVLDINDSSNSSIDTHADDDGDTLLVTYLKYSGLPSADLFIDDADITLNSEVWDFSADAAYDHIIVPGFGTQLVGEAGAGANAQTTWAGPSGTAGAGEAVWDPTLNKVTTNETSAIVTTAISWFVMDVARMVPESVSGSISAISAAVADEAASDTDVGSVGFVAYGRI